MKLVIEGCSGSGKSTAIRRLMKYVERPIWGLWSEKLPAGPELDAPVYLHSYREGIAYGPENRIGLCRQRQATAFPAVFETLGVRVLREIPEGSLVLLDEIGFMENEAPAFRAELQRLLDGPFDLVIAIRDKHTELLDQIRSHPQTLVVGAREANDEVFCRRIAAQLSGGEAAE